MRDSEIVYVMKILSMVLCMSAFMFVQAEEATSPSELPSTEKEWKERLSPEQYRVLRKEGTERAFSGKLLKENRKGVFACAGCGNPVFSSETKYKSGTGWPSFWKPIGGKAIGTREDRKLWSVRTEVHCAVCGGHLGHVFEDGPRPTGLRYCINSVSLTFRPAKKDK